MDSDWLAMAAGMADAEKRRVEKKAQEEKQQIKGQYDKWCTDHGVPAPPENNCQSKQGEKNEGSVLLGLVVIGIALFIVFWLSSSLKLSVAPLSD